MTPIYLYNNKILIVDNKLAISNDCCCCCCNKITINDLKNGNYPFSWSNIPNKSSTPMFGNVIRPECPSGSGGDYGPEQCDWHLKEACLRWVCRCVDDNLNLVCEQTHGGASVTNKNLSQLVINAMGAETESGCYIYTIEFFGWQDREGPGGWISSDDMYSVYKTKLPANCFGAEG